METRLEDSQKEHQEHDIGVIGETTKSWTVRVRVKPQERSIRETDLTRRGLQIHQVREENTFRDEFGVRSLFGSVRCKIR